MTGEFWIGLVLGLALALAATAAIASVLRWSMEWHSERHRLTAYALTFGLQPPRSGETNDAARRRITEAVRGRLRPPPVPFGAPPTLDS